jgi:hypothetical protein
MATVSAKTIKNVAEYTVKSFVWNGADFAPILDEAVINENTVTAQN